MNIFPAYPDSSSSGVSLSVTGRTTRLACCALVLAALSGCGESRGGRGSQVVATVNDQEITVMQLNQALRAAGPVNITPELRRRAIDSLTSEELLVQAALKADIDRDPAFVQALEQARRGLLAQFFAERVVYPRTAISAAEVERFYRSMPLLFANRREFRLTTFRTDESDITPAVSAELDKATSVEYVRRVLDAHAITYVTQMISIAPEELPIEELPAYANASIGDVFYSRQGEGKLLLMAVAAIQEDVPLSLEIAKPRIEQYLRNARNRQAAEEYLKGARATAKIHYAEAAEAPPDAAPAPAPTSVQTTTVGAAASTPAAAPTPTSTGAPISTPVQTTEPPAPAPGATDPTPTGKATVDAAMTTQQRAEHSPSASGTGS